MRHPPLEIHASDRDECLARFRAEVIDGVDSASVAGLVGTAVHRVAEAITLGLTEHPMADLREIGAAALKQAIRELDVPPAGVVDALDLLDRMTSFGARMSFRLDMGWSGRPEFRWALDENLEPVPPCDACRGTGVASGTMPPSEDDGTTNPAAFEIQCGECAEHPGWSRPTLASGRIDLIEWTAGKPRLRITDWKTERAFRSAEDAFEDWQARLYVRAALAYFPEATEVEFRFGMIRHDYFATADFRRGDPWEWTVETRLRAIREMRERAVASNLWPETPGPWCGWCPIMHACKKLEAVREEGGAPADLEPGEIARRWKGLQRLTDSYEKLAKGLFESDHDDLQIPLGDAKGTVLGYKPVEGWETVRGYEETIERVRQLVPEDAWKTTWEENFRFCAEHLFAGRVKSVLKALRVTDEVRDTIVIPITKTQLTTFRPDPPARVAPGRTLKELDDAVDRWLDGG